MLRAAGCEPRPLFAGSPGGLRWARKAREYKNLVGGSHHLELPALAVFLNVPPPIICT